MSWWSELKTQIKEFFFGKEEKEPDVSPYVDGQDKLNEQLKKMDDEYKAAHDEDDIYEDIADLVPPMPDFEYREYKGDDEQTIKDKTTTKYDDLAESGKQSVTADYEGKIGQVESKKDKAESENKLDVADIESEYEKLEKEIRNSLVEKGMMRSSINSEQNKKAQDMKLSDLSKAEEELRSQLASYDAEIDRLGNEKDAALNELNISIAQKLQEEIDSLLEKRQKQIDDINKYNDNLKAKEADYIEDRQLAIEKQIAERLKNQLEIEKMEQETGYAGEKAENYQQRYQLAYDYYMDLPKSVAVSLVESNDKLKDYLGYYYARLVAAVQKKPA